MENDARSGRGECSAVRVRGGFPEARQKIFNLRGTPGQTVKEFHSNPATEVRRRKRCWCYLCRSRCRLRARRQRAFGSDDNNMTRAITTLVVANANEGWRIFAAHTTELAVRPSEHSYEFNLDQRIFR